MGFPGGSAVKNPSAVQEMQEETEVRSLGREDLPKKVPEQVAKEMETHSSVLAWEVPWKEEPGGLQNTRSQSQTDE